MNKNKAHKDTTIHLRSIETVETSSPFRFTVTYWRGGNEVMQDFTRVKAAGKVKYRNTQIFIPFEICWNFYLRSLEHYTAKQANPRKLEEGPFWLFGEKQPHTQVRTYYHKRVGPYLVQRHDILRMVGWRQQETMLDHVVEHTAQQLRSMGAQI